MAKTPDAETYAEETVAIIVGVIFSEEPSRVRARNLLGFESAHFFAAVGVAERKSKRRLNLATWPVAACATFFPDHRECVS